MAPAAHRAEVESWRSGRYLALSESDGWLALAGLFWLPDGVHTFGAAPGNDLVYEGSPTSVVPAVIGRFRVSGREVTFEAQQGVTVYAEGEAVTSLSVGPDSDEAPLRLSAGSLQWRIIVRQKRLALRLWDEESAVRTGFSGIESFLLSADWRLSARFESEDPPDTIQVPNILGGEGPVPSPGSVVFEVGGERYRLKMWKDSDDPENFFTAFADGTNGEETYGGGRFIWVDAPDDLGRTVIDFNKAYNPPCVFTAFATCPLPPRENRLPFRIPAGEKEFH